jgi:glucan 1,3-beta-glucosidase
VGIWNSHFRVGGAAGSSIETNCNKTLSECKAAWGLLHLTSSSSVYIENMWGWTADHDLDGSNTQLISVGRGALIEATKATWLVGTAMEHNTLYQYNFNNAENVYAAMQQTETPYWQGNGNVAAPAPWSDNLIASDPTFSECAAGDNQCAMALFQRVQFSKNLFLYGGCLWVFFNNYTSCNQNGGICQQNAIQVLQSTNAYFYGTNTHAVANVFLNANQAVAMEVDNSGGWGGVVAAYLINT